MKPKRTNKTLVRVIFFGYATILFTLCSPLWAKDQSITWTPGKIDQSIALGERKDLTVSFTSSGNLNNANLWVVPELQSVMTVEPTAFSTIKANIPQQVTLHLFVPPNSKIGTYDGTVHLRVGSKTYPQQLKVKLQIISVNHPPVANAGKDQNVKVGDLVTLDGRNSYDPDHDLITYKWKMIKEPSGSNAELSDSGSVMPAFTPDKPGEYDITLTVNDGQVDSSPDDTIVIAARPNVAPTAVAGSDQSVVTGSTVYLNGSGSSDPDGDALTYHWEMFSQPSQSTASLDNPSSSTPSFFADKDGKYIIVLTVNDGQSDSIPDDVIIVSATPNAPPVAYAGDDKTVSRNKMISLDGTGSYDPDNDPLTYSWTIKSKPPESTINLNDPSSSTPQILADKLGEYVFTLKVYDGKLYSDSDTVVITVVNDPPVADAGPDQDGVVGNPIDLNGSGSSDPNGDTLTYKWTISSWPTGNSASIVNPTSMTPTITPNVPGVYVIQLVVNDGSTDSSPDAVKLTIQGIVPDVVGQPQASAEAAINGAGLTVGAITQTNNAVVPVGCVISQVPAGGAQAAAGSPVFLDVSLGVVVPSVIGMTQADAEAAIKAAKLQVGNVTLLPSVTVQTGSVILQNPLAGTSVTWGTLVVLVVSLGDGAAVIGPDGGVVEVKNPSNPLYGFRLEVPPGALSLPEPVTITVNSAPCDSINPILAARQLASHQKSCLTAFTANPDGLSFSIPATVRLPVPPLTPGWTPLQIGFDLEQKTYWIVPGEIVYLGQEKMIEMKIAHFSGTAAVQAQSNTVSPDALCQTCQAFNANINYCSTEPPKDQWQDSCCLITQNRGACYPSPLCHCCKEELVKITVGDADFQSGDCQIVGSNITIEYPTCNPPYGVIYHDQSSETTPPCKDMILTVDIVSDKSSIRPCEEVTMKAQISGTSQNGKVLFSAAAFPAKWDIISGDLINAQRGQDIGTNGKVIKGLEPGVAVIKASAVGDRDVENRYFGVFYLTVEEPVATLTPSDPILDVGQTIELLWSCPSCEPASPPGEVQWNVTNPYGVELPVATSPQPGDVLQVTALKCGKATVQADYQHCGMKDPISEVVLVTVRGTPPRHITVTPNPLTLGINESKLLTGLVTDANGSKCPNFRIDGWQNVNLSDAAIATVDSAGKVTGHSEGTVFIRALSGNAHLDVPVHVHPATVVVTPSPVTMCVSTSPTMQLTAFVTDALGNPYTGCDVSWHGTTGKVILFPTGSQVLVQGVSEGQDTVYADCGNGASGSAAILVQGELTEITLNPPYNASMKVFTSVVGLSGTIVTKCGEGLVTGLVVTVEDANGETQVYPPAPVKTDGSFAIAVGLNWGVNHLRFETYVGSNKISNNMEIIDFTLHRVAHCLKDGNTLSLPTNTATGNPLFWMSSNPGIVSVDSSGHILTANSDGWAWIYANVGTLTIWRAVGVSSATNYVPTYPGDPFYKPAPVPPPPPPAALYQILEQISPPEVYNGQLVGTHGIYAESSNGKYFGGWYTTHTCPQCTYADWQGYPPAVVCQSTPGHNICKTAAYLYDGISFIPIEVGGPYTSAKTTLVNEIGQAVISTNENYYCECLTLPYPHRSKLSLYDRGSVIPLSVPAYDSWAVDINNKGQVILQAWDSDGHMGATYNSTYLYDNETGSLSQIPDNSLQINDSGKILGVGSDGVWVYKDGVFETVAYTTYSTTQLYESGQVLLKDIGVLLTRCAHED